MASGDDVRLLPRLPIYVASAASRDRMIGIRPLLDTGVEDSLFDGAVALELGRSEQDIVARASDTRAVTGVGRAGPRLVAYRHELFVLISLGRTFAVLQRPLFLTAPNVLTLPVPGRRDFFREVDFVLLEAEQRFCLRFRDRSILHDSW